MEVSAPPTPLKNDTLETDAKVPITKFSQKTHPDGKTVAMSIGAPRLTANVTFFSNFEKDRMMNGCFQGKRVGRPPGTFKAQRYVKTGGEGTGNLMFLFFREESNKKNVVMLKHTTCKWNNCNIDFFTVDVRPFLASFWYHFPSGNRWTRLYWTRGRQGMYLLVGGLRWSGVQVFLHAGRPSSLPHWRTTTEMWC